MRFVCPLCRMEVKAGSSCYRCERCGREYPIICGIADFRIHPDPYISIEDDRRKGERLFAAAESRTFEEMLWYYYSITPEDPSDLAPKWVAHSLAEANIAEFTLRECGAPGLTSEKDGKLLDVGCSTGAMLQAAGKHFHQVVGLDVAFRWLVIGRVRLRQHSIDAQLVCGNAEAMPFPDGEYEVVTATDLIEHVRDAQATVKELHRVLAPGGHALLTTNNRYAPLPDPQVHLWGVGTVPRRWQPAYVARRRKDLHRYLVEMRSARELDRLFRRAGFPQWKTTAPPLYAAHVPGWGLRKAVAAYNQLRRLPLIQGFAKLAGPRLAVTARR